MQSYVDHTNRLLAEGKGYYCFCSAETLDAHRKSQLAAGLPPKYAGTCRNIPADEAKRRKESGEAAVVRLRVPEGRNVTFNDVVRGEVTFHTDVIGDPVLVRSDGIPAYNFAVVIDDALMKVTHVIRGEDHISNTPRQILLYEAYGYEPPAFAHLSLVMGPDHAPLSKRHGATSVKEFRDKGYLPEALVNYLALIGWSPGQNEELLPADELARRFRLENVAHSAGVFDEDKLAWANRHYLKTVRRPIDWRRSPSRTCARAARSSTRCPPPRSEWLEHVLARHGAVGRSLAAARRSPRNGVSLRSASRRAVDASLAKALAEELAAAPRLTDKDAFRALANRVKDRTGLKGKNLFHPIRVILTGAHEGPELDLIVPAIDRAVGVPRAWHDVVGCRERAAAVGRRTANPAP